MDAMPTEATEPTVSRDLLESVRHFNRFYTRYMGLFSRDYLKAGLSVTELRILHEISTSGRSGRDISQELGIDEGYTSRIVNRFVSDGWVEARASEADARRKDLSLTKAGWARYEDLAERTRTETARRLNGANVARAVAVMQHLEQVLAPVDPEAVELRDLQVGDIGWAIQRNGETYHSDFGFDASFEVFVGQILTDMLAAFDPKTHAATIAARGHDRLGSIFCTPGDRPGLAKLRVFFVEPHARGLRIGHRLMQRCLEQARALGYREMELMTIETQETARHLYASYGFELAEAFPTRLAGRDVMEEKWVLKL